MFVPREPPSSYRETLAKPAKALVASPTMSLSTAQRYDAPASTLSVFERFSP